MIEMNVSLASEQRIGMRSDDTSLPECELALPRSPQSSIWQSRWVLAATVVIVVPGLIWILLEQSDRQHEIPPLSEEQQAAMNTAMLPENPAIELDESGISEGQYYTVDQVVIPDEEFVVGVEIDGNACAYLLGGMNDIDQHIVHHQLGGQQFTVTYCDKSECIAVYDRTGTTAEIRNGGFSGETLWILYDGKRYEQDAEDIPLSTIDSVKTTWGEWKQRYPDTLVYVGLGLSYQKTLKEE